MRAFPAILVTLTLTTTMLTGCGRTVGEVPAVHATQTLQAQGAQSATDMASSFAKLLESTYKGQLDVSGSTVTLNDPQLKTVYDFAQTPKSGKVRVTAGTFSTEIAYDKLMQGAGSPNARILPAMVVPIAIQVGVGGALGVANYWMHHRGDKFDKQAAVKAGVEGMLAALIPITREIKYAQLLVPLAFALVKSAKTLNYKDLADAAMNMLDKIVEVVGSILTQVSSAVATEQAQA